MKYYHGTSTACRVEDILLPPSHTQRLREDFRKKHLDAVFLTISLRSAKMYAKKACVRFGGSPIVYIASPVGELVMNGVECICEQARIEGIAASRPHEGFCVTSKPSTTDPSSDSARVARAFLLCEGVFRAIVAGRYTLVLFEKAAEIVLIAEAASRRDLPDGVQVVGQKIASV